MAIGDSQAKNRLTVITVYGVHDNLLVGILCSINVQFRICLFVNRLVTVTSTQPFVTFHGRIGLPRLEFSHQTCGFLTL